MDSRNALAILNEIADTSARNQKEALLAKAISDPMMQEVVKWAYDPFIVFGLTPPKVETTGSQVFDVNTRYLWAMLHALANRKVTGGEAHQTVLEWMTRLDQDSAELLWRILSKDLRCGITAKTVNKVLPGTIPTFDVMLAHPFEEHRIGKWPVAVEPKLDGVRVICLVKNGTAQFFSRSGKSFPAVEHLGDSVVKMLEISFKSLPADKADEYGYYFDKGVDGLQMALDGEIISGSFADTVSEVRRKGAVAEKAEYHIFDAVPYSMLTADGVNHIPLPYKQRREFVRFLVGTGGQDGLRLVPSYMASSHEEIQKYYTTFRAKGLEGAMVKTLEGTYYKKRSNSWMKIKNEETEDLEVIGAFEGTGKYEGQLGGIVCRRGEVEVRVGGGFTDLDRVELWKAYREDEENGAAGDGSFQLIGRLAEVEFHEVTPDGSLRHPRFVRFRDDKKIEEAA